MLFIYENFQFLLEDIVTFNGEIVKCYTKISLYFNFSYLNQELFASGEASLLQDDIDDVSRLQNQVAKLTRHVMRLEDESKQRETRDLILYCILSSYFLLKFANWLVRK